MNPDNQEPEIADLQIGNPFFQTRMFRKATQHYTVTTSVLLLYQILKLCSGCFIIFGLPFFITGCSYNNAYEHVVSNDLRMWLLLIAIHSLFMLCIYFSHIKYIASDDSQNILALRLDQLRQEEQNEEARSIMEDSRRISILARQIKFEVLKSSGCGKCMLKFMIFLFQILFLYGLYLFFKYYNASKECIQYEFYMMNVIIILSLYQYIDFYIICLFGILCSPFLIIFGIYYLCSQCSKRQELEETRNRLRPQKYKPNKIKGDPECIICRCPYELDESIIVLNCSPLHHYHESCIMAWLTNNNTCPLCRKNV